MSTERDDPIFVISVAARIVGVHAQTLRYYERAGLIAPSRSDGNRRYYSQEDMERLRRIKTLIDDMGVNLAGAEIALRLLDRIQELEQEVAQLRLDVQRLADHTPPALGDGKTT
ncbi:MAG: helix-turn-helix transcriptional regulator [Chloroflexi bacterium]|nr:helix-turn-helix transcriptional regulator [Chloroflexota bacterium]